MRREAGPRLGHRPSIEIQHLEQVSPRPDQSSVKVHQADLLRRLDRWVSMTAMSYSARTALGSAIKRAFKASSFQHAANRDASWFFFSVMVFGFSNSRVKMGGLNLSSQHGPCSGIHIPAVELPPAALLSSSSESSMFQRPDETSLVGSSSANTTAVPPAAY